MSDHTKVHPRRKHIHQYTGVGERIADATANAIGSWSFIIIQAVIMAVWVLINTLTIFHVIRFDSYPFVFLNLAMSAEAAFSAPIIMQSQNRQAMRDRKRDDTEASEVEQLFNAHDMLLQINRQQLEILQLLKNQDNIELFIGRLEKQEQELAKQSAMLTNALTPRRRPMKQVEAKDD